MLELRSPEGAFARIEDGLRERGFFAPGGEDLVADLYLGYGLSQTIRRDSTRPPPEPCPLPLAAVSLRDTAGVRPWTSPAQPVIGPWERTWTTAEYAVAVESVRSAIARGDVYQVNLVQHLSAPFTGEAGALAASLASLNPLVSRALAGDGWTIVSASPEVFLSRRGRVV